MVHWTENDSSGDRSSTDYMMMCQMRGKKGLLRQLLVLGPSSWVSWDSIYQCREGSLGKDLEMKIKSFVLDSIKF